LNPEFIKTVSKNPHATIDPPCYLNDKLRRLRWLRGSLCNLFLGNKKQHGRLIDPTAG